MTCCNWGHVRPCGYLRGEIQSEFCRCGCSAWDDRCGGGEWWIPFAVIEYLVPNLFLNIEYI